MQSLSMYLRLYLNRCFKKNGRKQMNKQEAIELIKKLEEYYGFSKGVYLEKRDVINIVSQIDEPQKVVIPKFVAEWIKKYRHAHTLLRVLKAAEKEQITTSTVNDWILYNKYDFIKAWIDGYDVELDETDE